MSVQFVKSPADLQSYISRNKYLVVYFTATWCGPCQAIKPVIEQIYDNPSFHKIEVVKVDLDTQQELSAKYEITSVPTFIFMESGKSVKVIKGASMAIQTAFEELRTKADADGSVDSRSGNGETAAGAGSGVGDASYEEIKSYVPSGYSVLNSYVAGGEFEALNAVSLAKSGAVKDVFDLKTPNSIYSDADAQMILHIPLTHVSKVYSVLLKTSKVSASDDTNLDEDDVEETQLPNLIKVWANKSTVVSFDDAVADNSAAHIEKLDLSEGWYECKFKFVRFQNVQSLNLFFDGEDEDFHTVVDKIVIIGLSGEEKDHKNMVDKLTHDEE